jgi:hypothetical protein
MAKIYISYAHSDVEIAREIVLLLTQLGHEVSVDVGLLSLDQRRHDVLTDAVRSSHDRITAIVAGSLEVKRRYFAERIGV